MPNEDEGILGGISSSMNTYEYWYLEYLFKMNVFVC